MNWKVVNEQEQPEDGPTRVVQKEVQLTTDQGEKLKRTFSISPHQSVKPFVKRWIKEVRAGGL